MHEELTHTLLATIEDVVEDDCIRDAFLEFYGKPVLTMNGGSYLWVPGGRMFLSAPFDDVLETLGIDAELHSSYISNRSLILSPNYFLGDAVRLSVEDSDRLGIDYELHLHDLEQGDFFPAQVLSKAFGLKLRTLFVKPSGSLEIPGKFFEHIFDKNQTIVVSNAKNGGNPPELCLLYSPEYCNKRPDTYSSPD